MAPAAARTLPRWRTDVFLAAAMALNYADRAVLPVVLPAMRAELGLSDIAFGMLGTLFLWSYAISAPIAGILADRFSRRRLIVATLAAWSVSSALTGAANGFAVLALLRVALGISESFYIPTSSGLLADHHGLETRGRAMGLQNLALNAGPILGGAWAGFIAERYGWRYAFMILGAAGIALAATSRSLLSDAPASVTASASAVAPAPRAKIGAAIAYLSSVPTFMILLGEAMLSSTAVWIFFNWLPLFLFESYGRKMGEAGVTSMAVLMGPRMLGTAAGAWLSDRAARADVRNRMLVFAVSFLAASPCLLCFVFRPTYPAATLAIAVFSFLSAFGGVNEITIICDVIPPSFRSTAVGVFCAVCCVSGGVGNLVAAFFKKGLGLGPIFAISGGTFFLAGLALFVGYRVFAGRDVARATAWADGAS